MLLSALNFNGDDVILGSCVMALIIGVTVVSTTKVIASHLRKSRRDDMEATLKMEMVQRGMSGEEIERVIAVRFAPEPHQTSRLAHLRSSLAEAKR